MKKVDLLLVAVVMGLTFIFWRHIPGLQFTGEGAFYFAPQYFKDYDIDRFFWLGNYLPLREDLLAKVLVNLMAGWFGPNVPYYMWFLLVWMIVTAGVMFWVAKKASGSRLAGFLMAIFSSLGQIGNYNQYSSGGYQYFLQRGSLVIVLLVSVWFLLSFVKEGRWWAGLLSLVTWGVAIFLGFYASWFLPVMVIFPVVLAIQMWWGRWKECLYRAGLAVPMVVINWLMIRGSPTTNNVAEGGGIWGFFINVGAEKIARTVAQQMAVFTFPMFWEEWFRKTLFIWLGVRLVPDKPLWWAEVVAVVVFGVGMYLVWRWQPKWRGLEAATLVSLLAMLVIDIKMSLMVYTTFGSLRYFHYPFIMWAWFWGLVMAAGVKRGGKTAVVSLFVVGLWMGYNYSLIRRSVAEDAWMHRANGEALEIIKGMSDKLRTKPVRLYVVGPFGGYSIQFALMFYGPGAMWNFEVPKIGELVKEKADPGEVYVVKFNYEKRVWEDATGVWRKELKEAEEAAVKV